MTLAGADILFYPTAIGSEPEEPELDSRDSWQRVMIGHAVANSVGVVAANRIGTEGERDDVLRQLVRRRRARRQARRARRAASRASRSRRSISTQIRRVRASMGFFRDRRPELYRPLVE